MRLLTYDKIFTLDLVRPLPLGIKYLKYINKAKRRRPSTHIATLRTLYVEYVKRCSEEKVDVAFTYEDYLKVCKAFNLKASNYMIEGYNLRFPYINNHRFRIVKYKPKGVALLTTFSNYLNEKNMVFLKNQHTDGYVCALKVNEARHNIWGMYKAKSIENMRQRLKYSLFNTSNYLKYETL